LSDFPKPTTTMSLSAWVYADSYSPWATIAKNFNADGRGTFYFGMYGADPHLALYASEQADAQGVTVNIAVDPEPLTPGAWHHVGFVADGIGLRIWRDGVIVSGAFYDGTFINPSPYASLEIGGGSPAAPGQAYWDGRIDDLGLWTRALTDEEMIDIYQAGLAGRPLSSVPEPSILALVGLTAVLGWFYLRPRRR